MGQIIIHVDMDAFYASVEIRDDPSLRGRPLIIGSMPDERGVVSTCSYEAREFGVRSGMNIKEAYRLCPDGVYKHPDFYKYMEVSRKLHEIWDPYASSSEPVALDETYLDVTETAGTFEKAREIARLIKERTFKEMGLTCSVGLAYSKAAAKIASEEMKPDGYFEILTPGDYVDLISSRDVRVLFSVGPKTAERLNSIDIFTVGDLRERADDVESLLGAHGRFLADLASGIDDRKVEAYDPREAKSVSREMTFQKDVSDTRLIADVMLLLAMSVEERARRHGLHGTVVSIKVTFSDMKSITRSRTVPSCETAVEIHSEAVKLLDGVKKRPVRLIGVGIFNLSEKRVRQSTLDDLGDSEEGNGLREKLEGMHSRYRFDFVKHMDKIYRVDSLHGIVEHMRIQSVRRRQSVKVVAVPEEHGDSR